MQFHCKRYSPYHNLLLRLSQSLWSAQPALVGESPTFTRCSQSRDWFWPCHRRQKYWPIWIHRQTQARLAGPCGCLSCISLWIDWALSGLGHRLVWFAHCRLWRKEFISQGPKLYPSPTLLHPIAWTETFLWEWFGPRALPLSPSKSVQCSESRLEEWFPHQTTYRPRTV